MAMAVDGARGGMEEQHLDYNARLISVRRHYNHLALDAECYESARSSDVGEDVTGEKEFGRSPGAVPFFWERAPGVAKTDVAGTRDGNTVPPSAIGHLRPPPAAGRSFSPTPAVRVGHGGEKVEEKHIVQKKVDEAMAVKEEEEEGVEVEEKTVEVVKPACKGRSAAAPRGRKQREPAEEVASTRAFAERVASRSFFGEIALSAIREHSPKGVAPSPARGVQKKAAAAAHVARAAVGNSNLFFESPSSNSVPSPARGSGQDGPVTKHAQSEDTDLFSDASETLPRTSYPVSSMSEWEGQLNRRPEIEPDTREYILQRFLPAAGALVAERQVERTNTDHAGRGGGSRDHSSSSSPLSRLGFQARPASRFATVRQVEKATEQEEHDDDDARHVSSLASKMGCGLLPRMMGKALKQSVPCFPFKARARTSVRANNVTRIRSPLDFPSARSTFEDDSQFDDAYSEFWDEEEEEEFLDRRLMEVRQTDDQLKLPGRSPPIRAPRFDLPHAAPSSGYTTSSLVVEQEGGAWLEEEFEESSDFSSSPEPQVETGPALHLRGSPPVHHDGRGFLGLPADRSSEPELVPRRAAAYREYFLQEPRSSDRGSLKNVPAVDVMQGRNKLEDFLRLERWNQPEAKDMDVQTWVQSVGHTAVPERTSMPSAHTTTAMMHSQESISDPQLLLCEDAEHAQSSRSSGESSFCGSEGLSFSSSSDLKSSEASSGTCLSTDHDDVAVKGWPLGSVQPYRHPKVPAKEPPVSVLLPPLPQSPSESWLWANRTASPLHCQKPSQLVLSKMYFDHGGANSPETNSKWQLMVRSGYTNPADRLRFSEELTDNKLLMCGPTGA